MRKKLSLMLVLIMIISILLTACNTEEDKNTQNVRLVEVTHSVFYAPQYIAIEKGFFESNGINIELINGGGADKCMTALLSEQADVALMGPDGRVN